MGACREIGYVAASVVLRCMARRSAWPPTSLHPTRSGCLTVVLIQGLASSPRAWVDLGNELTGDEEIRRSYQVWQVFYRSGAPIAYNEKAIRRALEKTLARFDPRRTSKASRDMVLVGHSMGGVIARLLVLDAGDALWRGFLGHAPDDEQRQRLAVVAPYLDLVPMAEVGRAVFLASPHRGAPMAGGRPGRMASQLIRLPRSLMTEAGKIADVLEGTPPPAPPGYARARRHRLPERPAPVSGDHREVADRSIARRQQVSPPEENDIPGMDLVRAEQRSQRSLRTTVLAPAARALSLRKAKSGLAAAFRWM